jgi:hypothetical protein
VLKRTIWPHARVEVRGGREMRRLIIMIFGTLAFAAAGATAGGPPVISTTDHSVNEPFTNVGIDCATGKQSAIAGVSTGVLHTLLLADGSFHFSGSFRGSSTNDDFPAPDGTFEATETFVAHFGDIFFSSGREIHTEVLSGRGTATATGAPFRFNAVVHIVLDANGTPKVDVERIVCR